ncbi:MAG TPA: hypothetical protein VD966_02845, partial [Pyrinomonadaceae bacterium]|nr:hypothetical protein [Pyrinomonadaceae bacterium]
MATVTIATFNCENLFARFKFKGKRVKQDGEFVYRPWTKEELAEIADKGFDVDMAKFETLTGDMRTLTAQAIFGTGADVIALQEVESLETLKIFNSQHLKK